jgi:hypothetical protein
MPRNFLPYTVEHLRKINAQRRALSMSNFMGVPILNKGQVMYTSEAQMDGEPASCSNCAFYNYGRSCQLINKEIIVKKLTYPPEPTADAKPIEYWPCCSEWLKGTPNYGPEKRIAENSPDTLGLGWINAPKPGQKCGGANCGGKNGGDDCDHYITKGPDKRDEATAFCRVLQQEVENGAVCSAWMDDDWLSWDKAQDLLKELNKKNK